MLPAALVSLLTVLFLVLWQALAQQTTVLKSLQEQVEAIEQQEEVNNRRLLEEQMGTLRLRQQSLERQFSDLLKAVKQQREQDEKQARERQKAEQQPEANGRPFLPPLPRLELPLPAPQE
ncbi:MAG: signal protein [Synechococcaceae bacterium WB9_4xB_025]|nr:signal protein [Synechococcaceae bacterium WB9_4xB_025]